MRDHRQLDGQQHGDHGVPVVSPEIGAPASEGASLPEVDLRPVKRGGRRACVRKSGEPYE
jgi:hypothetical protein